MTTRTEPWPPGTPCWIDYTAADVEAAKRFYGAVLGWTFTGGEPEYGGYWMCRTRGAAAAGLGPSQSPEQPAAWTTYLAVSDVDAAVARVGAAGGTVVSPPADVGDFGRMAIVSDTTGAMVGVWQASNHIGTEIVNEPGAVVWNEAHLTAPDTGREFYAAVFGYEYAPVEGAGEDYRTFAVGGEQVGGIGGMHASEPAGTPSYWHVYFMVPDADRAAAAAGENGGTVLSGPSETPFGRMATIADPAGVVFSVSGPMPS